MIDQFKHQQLRIGLVSPQQISAWATKILPNGEIVGEVTKPYTFHYKTNKPEKGGLFCERIFGPIKSGICACGNYRVIGPGGPPRLLSSRESIHPLSVYGQLSLEHRFRFGLNRKRKWST